MNRFSIATVSYIKIGNVLQDKGKQLDIGVDGGTMYGRAKVSGIGLLKHGWFFEMDFALFLTETFKVVLRVPISRCIVFLIQNFLQKIRW